MSKEEKTFYEKKPENNVNKITQPEIQLSKISFRIQFQLSTVKSIT